MIKPNSSLKEKYLHELEANLWEAWAHFGEGKNSELHEDKNVIWYRTPLSTIPYNAVLKFKLNENVDKEIDQIIEKISKDGHQFMWLVTPSSEPKDLAKRLKKRGLIEIEVLPGMARTLSNLPDTPEIPPGIEIKEVKEQQGKQELIEFAVWRWSVSQENIGIYEDVLAPFQIGHPESKISFWQAWKDGEPVSKVAINRSENSVGVYAVATKPEARRMGLARLLTFHALHEMRKEGYEIAVLHSTPMAEALYASMGFEKQVDFYLYASTDAHL
ncbi:GNAT family N-acetyltransferase [bacterium]|nr:GNAT family N-acetyltransferase [bacterium]